MFTLCFRKEEVRGGGQTRPESADGALGTWKPWGT